MLTSTSAESNSLWSSAKTPTTVNCLSRGRRPAGVTWPCGEISVTRSPTSRRSPRATPIPRTMPNSPGLRSAIRPERICEVLPVLDPRVAGDDLDVRRRAEDAPADLLLEAVHHRHHRDQRPDAERNAHHRDERDERDEVRAAL